jgi:hypothetical protein
MKDERNNLEEYKAKFFAIYSNLPLNVRDDIVLVLDQRPITWNVAYLEIISEGEKTNQILKDLVELDLIK